MVLGNRHLSVLIGLALAFAASATLAGSPPDYYDSVDTTDAATLRVTLHEVIDDHTRIRYTHDTQIDTWDVLELADEDPNDAGRIIDVYRNASYSKFGQGNEFYEREHTALAELGIAASRKRPR